MYSIKHFRIAIFNKDFRDYEFITPTIVLVSTGQHGINWTHKKPISILLLQFSYVNSKTNITHNCPTRFVWSSKRPIIMQSSSQRNLIMSIMLALYAATFVYPLKKDDARSENNYSICLCCTRLKMEITVNGIFQMIH